MSRHRFYFTLVVCFALAAIATLFSTGSTTDSTRGPTEAIGNGVAPPPRATTVTSDLERESADARAEAGGAATSAILATIVLQVDEIDRCIDPVGSSLSIHDRSTGETFTTTLGDEGGALFEAVPIATGGSEFEIGTGVADRRCFPSSFSVGSRDLEGEPPSYALSVALIHDHGLRGRVFDATDRNVVTNATIEVDSFAVTHAVTDAEGRYSLELPEPRGSLVVRAPGYQELWWAFPERRGDGSTWLPSERDFELLRDPLLSILEIQVNREDGSPAAGGRIEFHEGSDVAYANALSGFADVAARDRYLAELSKTLDGVGRVTRPDGNPPTTLDETGSILVHVMMPCALRILVMQDDERADHEIVLTPAARERIELRTRSNKNAPPNTPQTVTVSSLPIGSLVTHRAAMPGRLHLSHIDGGIVPPSIRIRSESWHLDTWTLATHERSDVVTQPIEWPAGITFVSAVAGLLGGQAAVEGRDVTLEVRPLRRIRVEVVDRERGSPLLAQIHGASRLGRTGDSIYAQIPCGRSSLLVIRSLGHQPALIRVGDLEGIPRLRIELEPE